VKIIYHELIADTKFKTINTLYFDYCVYSAAQNFQRTSTENKNYSISWFGWFKSSWKAKVSQ